LKIFIFIFLIIIQFPNLNIPGRYFHISLFALFYLFIHYFYKRKKLSFNGNILFLYFYILLITFISILISTYINQKGIYTPPLISVFKAISYLTNFLIIYLLVVNLFKTFTTQQIVKYILITHIITLLAGLIIYFVGINNVHIFNHNPSIILGRLALFDKEPSYATYRVVILLFIICIYMLLSQSFQSKILSSIYFFIILILLSIIRSKSTIVILPLSFLIALIFLLKLDKRTLKNFLLVFSVFLVSSYFIVNSSYFHYTYNMVFKVDNGSALSRYIGFLVGIKMFLSNPLGYGYMFQTYTQHYLMQVVSNFQFLNDEISGWLAIKQYNTILDTKNGFTNFIATSGVVGLYFLLKLLRKNLYLIKKSTHIPFSIKLILSSAFIYSFVSLFVSALSLNIIIYFTIFYILTIKLISKEKMA